MVNDPSNATIKRLRNTLGKLEIALSCTEEAIAWTDQDGQVKWSNAAFQRLVDLKQVQILNQSIYKLLPLAQEGIPFQEANHPIKQIIESRASSKGIYSFISREGKKIFLELIANWFMANESHAGAVVTIQDVTELLKIQEQTQQLKIAKNFASTISHELRTPLTAIKSAVDMILNPKLGNLNEKQNKYADMAKRNIDRLHALVNDVLNLTKIEAGKVEFKFESLDMHSIITDSLQSHQNVALKKGITLKAALDPKTPDVWGDKTSLYQVLDNLLSNSIKFTDQGSVTIFSKYNTGEGFVQFCIKDTGRGIPSNQLDAIFDKFIQAGDSREHVAGTGLGLSICKEIIQKHKGKIWVESELNKGSKFYFTLSTKDNEERK